MTRPPTPGTGRARTTTTVQARPGPVQQTPPACHLERQNTQICSSTSQTPTDVQPRIAAAVCAFSLTSRITQRDGTTGRDAPGQGGGNLPEVLSGGGPGLWALVVSSCRQSLLRGAGRLSGSPYCSGLLRI